MLSITSKINISHIMSINRNNSVCGEIKAYNKVKNCRFTSSWFSHKCNRLTLIDMKIKLMKYRFICIIIGKPDIFKIKLTFYTIKCFFPVIAFNIFFKKYFSNRINRLNSLGNNWYKRHKWWYLTYYCCKITLVKCNVSRTNTSL